MGGGSHNDLQLKASDQSESKSVTFCQKSQQKYEEKCHYGEIFSSSVWLQTLPSARGIRFMHPAALLLILCYPHTHTAILYFHTNSSVCVMQLLVLCVLACLSDVVAASLPDLRCASLELNSSSSETLQCLHLPCLLCRLPLAHHHIICILLHPSLFSTAGV